MMNYQKYHMVRRCFNVSTTKKSVIDIISSLQHQNRHFTTFHLPDYSTTKHQPPLTKIVATIGPTSEQEIPLKNVTGAGMNIMRLNFSHATRDEVSLRISNLQKATSSLYHNQQVAGILLDTKGPEIRTGKLQDDTTGHSTVTLEAGNIITLHTSEPIRDKGSTATDLYIDYPYLSETVTVGSQVLLDDGACILHVIETSNKKFGSVTCKVQNTAALRSRAGVNLPLADTSQHLPALSNKDKDDILYGMSEEVDIDYIAASFVQTGQGVRDIRQYIQECADKLHFSSKDRILPLIISKVETASSLQHFDDILHESDGIMVARGDLGVEIPLQQVTNAQKEMIRACNAVGKPCIVATQMLESMTKSPRPTRAEVADVTNAVYDGADVVMTSGETAKGKYPTETIQFMQNILLSAEEYINRYKEFNILHPYHCNIPHTPHSVVAAAAVTAANRIPNCQAIIVMMHGQSVLKRKLTTLVAAYRPVSVPIIPICSHPKSARQLMLYRGVRPVILNEPTDDYTTLCKAKELYHLESGEPIVIVASNGGYDDDDAPSSTMNVTVVP